MLAAVVGLQASGTTLVVATHDPAVAGALDRRIELEDGRVTS